MDITKMKSAVLPPDDERVWLGGSLTGITYEVIQPDGDWAQYFPRGERQKFRKIETMGCTGYTANDSVETQVNRMIRLGLIETEPIKDWINENGDLNLSDRFTAKMSGTTPNGNSMNSPAESLRVNGCCPEKMWAGSDDFEWNDYYSAIPTNVKTKAKKFLDYFTIQYQYLDSAYNALREGRVSPKTIAGMIDDLKQAPINIATACCPGWFNGDDVVKACNQSVIHATLLGKIDTARHILDHYDPFQKKLSMDYFIAYPLQIVVKPKDIIKKKNMDSTQFIITNDLKFVRNLKTGAFGRIMQGKLKVVTGTDRGALMLLDDKIRNGGMNISDEIWQSLPKENF